MHMKHRNGTGNVYRSNAMGVGGLAAASRISPEGSMRGHRMYNTDYRNYSHDSHGRGSRSKQFQPTPQKDVDIFMEAGKLAAEYLISKGVLPPNALSGKWQTDGLKNHLGGFQGFRQQEGDKTQIPTNGRVSVHSRLGNAAQEVGPGRRRYSDEYNSNGSRSSARGRKRTGSFKNYGSEVNRELGRSGSWADKSRASPGMEADSDTSVGHHADQPSGKDDNGGKQKSSPFEVAQQVDREAHLESGLEKCDVVEVTDADDGNLSNDKYLPSDTDGEPVKRFDDANKSNDEGEVVEERRNGDLQQKHDKNKKSASPIREDTLVRENCVDLLKQCKFVHVPTKARSSLTIKGSKVDQNPMNEDENIFKKELSEGSGAYTMDDNIGSSSGSASSQQNHELKILQSAVLNAPTPAVEKELDVTDRTRPGECFGSASFPEISLYKGQKPDEELSGFQSSNSTLMERGEKRAIDYNSDIREDCKKIRQWVPLLNAQSDGSQPLATTMENQPTIQESRTSQSAHVTLAPDQESLDISLFPKGHTDPCEFMEEKQLFPASFKTCDLNLVGSCDVNENNDADPILVFSSINQTGQVGTSMGIDLAMSNNHILPNKNHKHGIKDNHIEVIDLENDSAQEHQSFNIPDRRGEFTDLDGFPTNVHNANGMSDVQDGYGLMISELLANESPNCSSVPTDLNSLHNHMGLPNTEGMLGDDDSIYMSLGEIPISLLEPWEQPPQDYGKPF